MSFETDEIKLYIQQLTADRESVITSQQNLLSSLVQLPLVNKEVGTIISQMVKERDSIDNTSSKEEVYINCLNKINAVIGKKVNDIKSDVDKLTGIEAQMKHSLASLYKMMQRIDDRNENQRKLIQKLKSGSVEFIDEKKDIQYRKIGDRPEGLANIRRAKEQMKKDEDMDLIQEKASKDTS
jgi:hypothetical protein